MELKELLPIIIGAIGVIAAIVGIGVAVWQSRKSQSSEKKNVELQQQNLELQRLMLEREKEKDADNAFDGFTEIAVAENRKKSDADTYLEHIREKFKYLDFTGLNAILQKPLLLEKIYVKLRAKKSFKLDRYHSIGDFKALDEEKEKEAEEEDHDFVTVFQELQKEFNQKREPLKAVILGHPGSGKTTLMKWIAMQCTGTDQRGAFTGLTPVFISLKDLGREPDKTFRDKNILELTCHLLKQECNDSSFFSEQFEDNNILFLLDGLDEVADEDIRREVIKWIQSQNIRRNSLLITSRFSGLQEAKGLKFHDAFPVFHILDFDIADIERFLENWYKNIEIAVAGDVGKKEIHQAEEKGETQYEDLMKTIKDDSYENLRQLAVNPLLLTIIAIVHRTRAVLPKERHKLYEECLKVMIELWNVANRKIDVSFSVENSLNHLAKLAVAMMKQNRRELERSEIDALLPGKIETHPVKTFLREMVLKAGLLYQSEGKYGFLHLTFQEYLAAWYFARGENQNDILDYRDKDYWTETFKLFVNIGNARVFYSEIIEHLEEKKYWQHMQLWDDCLRDIVVEEVQKELELKFARKVLEILPGIAYKEENEEKIIILYAHYPLYKYAPEFVEQGWQLFHNATHPFVQSVGSSILNKAGKEPQARLMAAIKERIDAFEALPDKDPQQLQDFHYQNNNSFILLAATSKKPMDFNFALVKLKSENFL